MHQIELPGEAKPSGRPVPPSVVEPSAHPALTGAQLGALLAKRVIERDEALAEVSRLKSQLERRLAERTIERDDVARSEAVTELTRSNAELKVKLAERTIERDDIARDDALTELARTNAELEKRLAARTIERDAVAKQIASIELTRTNAAEDLLRLHAGELESLNAELESFSYSVSHDLRAPVRAVLGFVRAIEEECAADIGVEGKRLLGIVANEASRMGDLIDDLLAFSKLGRQPMRSAVVDMNALARVAVAEYEAPPGSAKAVATIADLPAATGDRALLGQVWVNLISNAFKYASKQGSPEVHIWATRTEDATTYHVRDNGVGFDMRYAQKLFGVFQRLHRADEFPGTGVGLAIVMRVVKRHGGTVRADAHIGKGATFSFELPNESNA